MKDVTRRQVLAGGAALATGAVGASLRAQEEPVKPVGWAILGLGGYALGQIMPRMRLSEISKPVAVISGSPDKAKRVAGEYGIDERNIYNYENLESIADNPEIEVVYVITPPGTHAEFTIRSLKAGKHVCCEKPMASNSQECQEMVDTAKEMGKRLQIGYRCHYEPHNLKAMEICRSGQLGAIRTIRSEHGFTLGRNTVWHESGELGGHGAISEIGVYAIQAQCYIAGEDPVEVFGTRHKLEERFSEVEDTNHWSLMFPSGAQGLGATSYTWNANNLRVLGQRGRIDAEPATGYGGHQFTLNGNAIEVDDANQWVGQMDDLSLAVRDPERVIKTPGEMGMRDIKIIEGILRSADTGESVKL